MARSGVRKLALIAHVTSSIGWMGAVACFLALAIAGLTGGEDNAARAAYVAMKITTWAVIVPLCLASLLTGLIESLLTPWGLFRHYWVIAKLVLTTLATVVLLAHTQPIGRLALAAANGTLGADLHSVRVQLLVDAAAALFVLLVTTVLAIYKPRGLTRYGWRKQHEWKVPVWSRALLPASRAGAPAAFTGAGGREMGVHGPRAGAHDDQE
jgi:hypothetical protein